ncbi:MAG: ATP-binding protein [Arcobacteraceae bacterium]|jgi:anti-sigma regulatory factor (Ser/Thr protein kinase)|nr:ATP-binding protein [Arcobacteraceae bacterium]MDX9742760.1 ATP-binding protein [Arcobacteraceae bacterium]
MFLSITNRSDIQALLGEVNSFLNSHNIEKIKKMEAHTIISEIIYNIKKYTPKGSIKLLVESDILHIYAQDSGEGIDDVHQSIKDGYSTSGTLGLGFASIFRLSDEIDIETSQNGTKIDIKKRIK